MAETTPKKQRNRSPNYPVVSLKAALEYLEQLRKFANGTYYVPLSPAIEDAWQMKAGSSYGKQVAAALKAFGLVEDKGSGDSRSIRVSEAGAKILGSHSDRPKLLREAAIRPSVHKELWTHFNGDFPPDVTLRQYLLFDREGNKFSEGAVDDFLKEFRDTLEFAKLGKSDTMAGDSEAEGDGEHAIKPGDWIQRESEGQRRLPSPVQVVRIDEFDGDPYVIVDQEGRGFPMSEAVLCDPPKPGGGPPPPPVFNPGTPKAEVGLEESRWKLPSGKAIVMLPANMTAKDFKVLRGQIDLLEISSLGGDEDDADE
jgi:hypothetical protein